MNKNYKITGVVNYSGKTNKDDDAKNVIMLKITDEQIEKIKQLIGDDSKYDGTPLKEQENGEILLKLTSKFDVGIYDGDKLMDEDEITLDTIGKGSEVQVFFSLGDSTYKRRTFKVAYLKSVSILELIEATKFNPCDKDSEVEEL